MKIIPLQNPQLDGDAFFLDAGTIGVMLSHGLKATAAEVRPLANALHEAGYTVAGPLLPGHGTQPEDLNRVRWQDWLQATEQCYQRLKENCERVFVGGESTGALLALHLAAAHPEIAGGLLYAPALRMKFSRWDILKIYLMSFFIPYTPREPVYDDDGTPWQGYPVLPLKGMIQLLHLQRATFPLLPRIQQPLLIVQGKFDARVQDGVPDEIRQRAASQTVDIHWMPQSSHVVVIDKEMEQVQKITLDFLARH